MKKKKKEEEEQVERAVSVCEEGTPAGLMSRRMIDSPIRVLAKPCFHPRAAPIHSDLFLARTESSVSVLPPLVLRHLYLSPRRWLRSPFTGSYYRDPAAMPTQHVQ